MKAIIKNLYIRAVGSWLPENILTMSSLAPVYGEETVRSIIRTTGTEQVRIADKDMTASDMCQRAAEHLIGKEGIPTADIDGLVFVSQTADYILPATSVCLQDRLHLSKETVCMDIHYGCSGYIYGLFQAALWIQSGACRNVLVLAGDTTSRLINEHDKSLRMVFGECGTATLVSAGTGVMGFHIGSDGSGYDRLIVPAGGFRTPVSPETSVLFYDDDGNGRTRNDLYMDGMGIFSFAVTQVPPNISALMEMMAWNKEEVGFVALHQANEFMVKYIRKKLKVKAETAPVDVRDFGNTGPATIPLLFSDLCGRENAYDLSKVVMCGFGVGLSLGSIATDMTKTRFYEPINK